VAAVINMLTSRHFRLAEQFCKVHLATGASHDADMKFKCIVLARVLWGFCGGFFGGWGMVLPQ